MAELPGYDFWLCHTGCEMLGKVGSLPCLSSSLCERDWASHLGFPAGSAGKGSTCECTRPGLRPWVGRIPGDGNGNRLQCSCLENSMDRGAWQATYSPWGRKELDTTKPVSTHTRTQQSCVLSKVAWGFSEGYSCKPCHGHSAWPTVTIDKGYFFATINEI